MGTYYTKVAPIELIDWFLARCLRTSSERRDSTRETATAPSASKAILVFDKEGDSVKDEMERHARINAKERRDGTRFAQR
jgi:hypothetical protein